MADKKIDLKKLALSMSGTERARIVLKDGFDKASTGVGFLSPSEKKHLYESLIDKQDFARLIRAKERYFELFLERGEMLSGWQSTQLRLERMHLLLRLAKGLLYVKGVIQDDLSDRIVTESQFTECQGMFDVENAEQPVEERLSPEELAKKKSEYYDNNYALVIRDGKDNLLLQEANGEMGLFIKINSAMSLMDAFQVLEKSIESPPKHPS